MKNWKSLSVLILGVLATMVMVGCSCSNKKVNPTKIEVNVAEKVLFVGDSVDVEYNITPVNSSNCKVSVTANKSNIVSFNSSSFDAAKGTVKITANAIDQEGVTVTYSINGTNLKTTTLIKVMPDPIELNSPTAIQFSAAENAISFKNVANTNKYLIEINGVGHEITDPSTSAGEHFISFPVFNENVPLNLNEAHTVRVKAIGDGVNFVDGVFSADYKFLKYAPVTGLTANNGVLTWDSHAIAKQYSLKINNVEHSSLLQTNSYNFSPTEAGEYLIQISAVSDELEDDQGNRVFASEYCEEYKVTKLATPVVSLNNNKQTDGVIGNSVVTWQSVLGASAYKVKITPALGEISEFDVTTTEFEIDDRFLTDTNYTLEIVAVGEKELTIGGQSSSIIVKKLGVTDNFNIENNILTFNGISSASKYEITFTSDAETKKLTTPSTLVNLAEQLTLNGTYSISVRGIGLVTETINVANGVAVNTEKTITKLNNVTVTGVNNEGIVSWDAANGATNYAVYLNGEYINNSNTNSLTLSAVDLESGSHYVQVVAIGDGVSTISSGLANAEAYAFNKLQSVNDFSVINDVLTFEGVTGAINYSVKLNGGDYRLIGNAEGNQTYLISNPEDGVNEVYIISVGDDVKNISSNPVKFSVSRLNAPTNLKTNQGILTWDLMEGVKYKVYVGNNENGVETTNNYFTNLGLVGEQQVVKVKTIPLSGNYLSSAFAVKTVVKLNSVNEESIVVNSIADDNELSNYKLVWEAVAGATAYNVKIYGENNTSDVYFYNNLTDTFFEIPENYVADRYFVSITALGDSSTEGIGYVNSQESAFSFRKLDKPVNVGVVNNVLSWNVPAGNSPAGFKLGITYNNGEETFVNIGPEMGYSFDLSTYQLEDITIRIRSLGDQINLVTGEYSTPITINRANAIENLRVENGVVAWDKHSNLNAQYLVYISSTPENADSFVLADTKFAISDKVICEINGLQEGVNYSVYVVTKIEGMLYSDKSAIIQVTKLPTVNNFKVANEILSWDAVANATKYVVVDGNGNSKETTATQINFSEFNQTISGNYVFTIYAVGSVNETLQGYINGAKTTNVVTLTILSAPNSASIQNNHLIIVNNNTVQPTGYRIEFTHTDGTVVLMETTNTNINLENVNLTAGVYEVSIYSLGNNENLISGAIPLKLSNITKIDETTLGLIVLNGRVSWTADLTKTFDIYLNGEKVASDITQNYFEFNDLEKGVLYTVNIVGKKEGSINSNLSPNLSVQKLPDVENFRVSQTITNANTGESYYTFTWEIFEGTYLDNSSAFNYEVIAETPIEPFNGVTENGLNTAITFNYGRTIFGEFLFNIRANGTKLGSDFGYLNGDKLANSLRVTILKPLEFVSYNRESNTITINNENSNASAIRVTYQNIGTEEFVFTEDIAGNSNAFELNYPSSMAEGLYSVYFNCLGDVENNILMANAITKYDMEIIKTPTNVRMDNGYINWTHAGGEGIYYQVYLDGELVKFTQEVPSENPDEPPTQITVDRFSNAKETRIINDLISDQNAHTIYVKAIKENAIDSKISETITAYKLPSITDAKLENYKLYWSSVLNAEAYLIRCSNADMQTLFSSSADFNRDLNGLLVKGVNAGLSGYSLPSSIPAGSYGFYVMPIGNSVDSSQTGYLSGGQGNIVSVTVISNVTNVGLNEGIIVWDGVLGATSYKVEVFKGETITDSSSSESFIVYTNRASLEDIHYESGYYTVRIWALGNGTTSLNASLGEVAEIKVYKAPVPNNFKVRNGFISWAIPINDPYLLAINGGTAFTEETRGALLLAAKGSADVDASLSANLAHFRNLEVTINGRVFKHQTPYTIEFDSDYKNLIYSYDFNFTNIANPYAVSVRFIGGTTSGGGGENPEQPPIDPEQPEIVNINSKVLANEPEINEGEEGGGEGGEPTPPPMVEINNVVNGNYSQVITGYKLPAPQTPVGAQEFTTMIYKDSLYFTKVYVEGFDVNYLITAKCSDENKSTATFTLNETNKLEFEANVSDILGGTSKGVYKVPIYRLGIETGYIYTITVRAVGTADSGAATSGVYFTSYYDHSCEIEMLGKPNIIIRDGKLTFSKITNAISQELRIWSTSIGSVFSKDLASEVDGKYAEQISINENMIGQNPFVRIMDDGNYEYSLINNPLFPAGSYYVTCEAVGNGTTKISSGESPVSSGQATLIIHKFDTITGLGLSGGVFKWNKLSYNLNGKNFDAQLYELTILRRVYGGNTDGEECAKIIVKASEVLSDNGLACYYDLSSLGFPAQENGQRYEYAIQVSGCGTLDSERMNDYADIVVSGNSQTSLYYRRLLPPQDVKMVNGVLTWLDVDGSTSYEVYMLNTIIGGEGEELKSYGIITDGNYRQLTFNGSQFASNAVINLRIRAIPGSLTTEYLNGEFSIEILAKKLEMPNLRVIDGIIKWNNTDLNYAIAVGTSVRITKLDSKDDTNGTVIFEKDLVDIADVMNTEVGYDLTGLDSEIGSGYYKIEVSYVGSNGYVKIPTEGGEEDDPNKPEVLDDSGELPVDPPTEEPTDPPVEPPVEPEIDYCWFSSDKVSMVVFKLATPTAELYIDNNNNTPANYVLVPEIDNADYYQFTAVKYNGDGEITKTHTFTKYQKNTTQEYFQTITSNDGLQILFNLQAVADLDAQIPDQPNPFGQQFSIYCQVFGLDRLYNEPFETIYSISNKSNYIPVEVPITPSNLVVNSSTGLISWTNNSNNTKTRIKITYNNSQTPIIYSVNEGVSTFKLQTIGSFEVSVLSYITAQNGVEITSSYTDPVTGSFVIFESGSGTESDPYMISESKHLLNIDYYLDSYYELKNDIALLGSDLELIAGFLIGRDGGVFNGKLDGKGYSITNLQFAYNANQIAMFKEIGSQGKISNVKIGIKTGSSKYSAITFAGIAITNRGTISNVETLKLTEIGGDGEVIYNCLNNQAYAGFAYENYGTITNCVNNLNIGYEGSGTMQMNTIVAGLVSRNYGTITKSGNDAVLKGTSVGGIVYGNFGSITLSYNRGSISAISLVTNYQARGGGIAVMNMSQKIGGITYTGEINTCYVVMSELIVINQRGTTDRGYAGGIVADNNSGILNKCYVVIESPVNVSEGVFGIIAGVDNRGSVTNYYNNNYYIINGTANTLGASPNVSIASASSSKNDLSTTFVGNYSDVFTADSSNLNKGYPIFIWQLNQ